MSRIKDYLQSKIEAGYLEYNHHNRLYEPTRPTIKRLSDKELSEQSIMQAAHRLNELLMVHEELKQQRRK